jgi:hypothetical protein
MILFMKISQAYSIKSSKSLLIKSFCVFIFVNTILLGSVVYLNNTNRNNSVLSIDQTKCDENRPVIDQGNEWKELYCRLLVVAEQDLSPRKMSEPEIRAILNHAQEVSRIRTAVYNNEVSNDVLTRELEQLDSLSRSFTGLSWQDLGRIKLYKTEFETDQSDSIPKSGETYSEIVQVVPTGWKAHTLVGNGSNSLVIEGPQGFKKNISGNGDPRPIDFSPDGKNLVFLDSSPIGWDSIYVVKIKGSDEPKILTNADLNMVPLIERKERSIPTPVNRTIIWLNSTMIKFVHPTRGAYVVDIETGRSYKISTLVPTNSEILNKSGFAEQSKSYSICFPDLEMKSPLGFPCATVTTVTGISGVSEQINLVKKDLVEINDKTLDYCVDSNWCWEVYKQNNGIEQSSGYLIQNNDRMILVQSPFHIDDKNSKENERILRIVIGLLTKSVNREF